MGQKVNPISLRLGINRTWNTLCYFKKSVDYVDSLRREVKICDEIYKKLSNAGISKVLIERPSKKIILNVHVQKPGIVIGKKGVDIAKIKSTIEQITDLPASSVFVNVVEVKRPDLDAALVADGIVYQLEKRASYKKVIKKTLKSVMKMGARGVKICVAGRLGGAEIARTEWEKDGRVPLHTLRAEIDYARSEAHTTYGLIGVKVWIYKGEKKYVI